jgi:hypothetical protein
MVFFSQKFKCERSISGKTIYIFHTIYTQNDENSNEIPSLSVSGEVLYSENNNPTMTSEDLNTILQEIPKECFTQQISSKVLSTWLSDCKTAFMKSPDLNLLLHKVQNRLDETAPTATISSSEETSDWVLQWIPTRIHLEMPQVTIFWAPCYKTENTRIPDEAILVEEVTDTLGQLDLELQDEPHNTTRLIKNAVLPWVEGGVTTVPLADSTSLRLEFDYVAQKEKFRRRVREARIRAKLARYRAERLVQRFEDRFGEFPDEDDEEAHTEMDKTDNE